MAQNAKKTTNNVIQGINRSNIFNLVYNNGPLTRQDIVAALHLSLPTVTQNINQLLAEGLLYESGSVGNTGGRCAKTFSVVPDTKVAIGLDITRNHITTVAVDINGKIFYQNRIFCVFEYTDRYFRTLGDQVSDAVIKSGLDPNNLLGVGIGVPALVASDNQTIFYGEILKITGATCQDFSRYIDYPTALFNDANAACFAERWVKKDLGTFFYLMLSNNIGGAFIIDQKIYNGSTFKSSEVGHIRLHPNGRHCYCGQDGCVDAYCAATVLSSMTGGDLPLFFRRLRAGDAALEMLWAKYLDDLCLTIVNVHSLYDCTIVLGGYLGEYLERYMEEIRRKVKGLCAFPYDADFLVTCSYKTEAIAAGSALNYIDKFISRI